METLPVHDAARGGGASLRLFAALSVPAGQAQRLEAHAELAAARILGARVVDPGSMHVTFAFLGDVVEEYVPAVAHALDAAAFEVPGATLCSVSGIERFGAHALGIAIDVELLVPLDAQRDRFIDSARAYAPSIDQRAWRPHVTILRSRRKISPALVEQLPHPPAESWVVPELRLYASLPGPAGHQHRLLHAVPFGAPVARN